MIYRSRSGELLDEICFNHYGTEDQVERVLEANSGLAALGVILPLGTLITLPEKPVLKVRKAIRLWGGSNES